MFSRRRTPTGPTRRPSRRPSRRSALALTGVAAALGAGVVVAPPAQASVSTLCTGYAGCAALGMGNAGYAQHSGTMYWRMYSGHNCTNYAAYRMVQAGMPNTRPWSGGGNATYWGTSMSRITNGTPSVGAIAWWRAGVKPAGSAGHVAYVEKVVSADEIIVSQDSWNGDFSWTRVTRTSSGWPSGFVHFTDVRLQNVSAPVVSGTPKVGSTLSATGGTWSPSTVTLGYQWLADGVPVSGATARTLTPTAALVGKALSVRVTASGTGLSAVQAVSGSTADVLPSSLTSTAAPTVSGTPAVGSPLTLDAGDWDPAPDTLGVRWLVGGQVVPGATSTTFVPTTAHVGKTVVAQVTATRAGYPALTRSTVPTAAVRPAALVVPGAPTVTGTTAPGSTLRVTTPAAPAGTTSSFTWRRDGQAVPGATRSTLLLGAADLGHRISATWTISRPGYTAAAATSRSTTLVRARSSLVVTTTPKVKALTVSAVVTRADKVAASGTFVVRSRNRVLARVPVVSGRATTTLRDTSGLHRYRFRFLTTPTVLGSEVLRNVRIG